MRVRRLLAAVVTVGLVAPAAAVVSTVGSPASAAVATTIVSAYTDRPLVYSTASPASFGDTLYAGIDVAAADGQNVYGGTITVQRQLAGSATWDTVATADSAYLYSSDLKAEGNAVYRITYSGTADYAPSTADVAVQVQRKIDTSTISGKRAGFKGKISPKGKVKITVTKKQGKKYKKFKTLKSSKSGKFTVILPAPRSGKFYWKITFAGSAQFAGSEIKGYTY